MGIIKRLRHAYNAFIGEEKSLNNYMNLGNSSTYRPDRTRLTRGNERSIITAVYNRIALDCAAVSIEHVRMDDNNRYIEEIDSGLNNCLQLEANKDQTPRAFIQDVVMSMFDEGCLALVPVDTNIDPIKGSFDIETLRTGKIIQWYPDHIRVEVYNDRTGNREELTLLKENVAILENPFYAVMNERNSVLQRLIRKLNLLDVIDEQSGSGKLDLIIQLPYVIKSETRKAQANRRRADIEEQLSGSKYGIAYTDGTEKITQLNRSLENNLLKQIEYLTSMVYSQLGFSTGILDGTANEQTMLNYMNSTIEPIVALIASEMERKFLTKTARTQHQAIRYFSDPFKLIPLSSLSEIADKFTRNEIMSSNEIRQIIGMKPINDAKADELRNKNLNAGEGQEFATTNGEDIIEDPVKEE